jgi:hypothetical protein
MPIDDPPDDLLEALGARSTWDFVAYPPADLVFDDASLDGVLYGEGAVAPSRAVPATRSSARLFPWPARRTILDAGGAEASPAPWSTWLGERIGPLDATNALEALEFGWNVARDGRDDAALAVFGVSLALRLSQAGPEGREVPYWAALAEIERRGCRADEALAELFQTIVPGEAWAVWRKEPWSARARRNADGTRILARMVGAAAGDGADLDAPASCLREVEPCLVSLAGADSHDHDVERQQLYRNAAAVCVLEGTAGPRHPCTASGLNFLGRTLHEAGAFAGVVPLARRALAIRESDLGGDHLSVVTSLNNLAAALVSLGQLGEAEPLLLRATRSAPSYGPPYRWLAKLCGRRGEPGDREQEIAAWQRFLALGTAPPERAAEARQRLDLLQG